ncbi:MAG: tetratricopeptide repeat protein [Gammaproteobacteria bacterium]
MTIPVLLCLLAAACASPGGSGDEADNATQANTSQCAPGSKGKGSASDQGAGARRTCVHTGPIVIEEKHPVDPEIKAEFQQAIVLLKKGNYPDAIRMLKTVTGKTTKFSGPFIDLGIAYEQTKEYKKAEQNLKKALTIYPMHPAALNELGIVYRKTGRYSDARKVYEKLLHAYPNYMPAHKNLGVLCDIYIQDLDCALKQYETYLKSEPDDKKVKIWVADVKRRM